MIKTGKRLPIAQTSEIVFDSMERSENKQFLLVNAHLTDGTPLRPISSLANNDVGISILVQDIAEQFELFQDFKDLEDFIKVCNAVCPKKTLKVKMDYESYDDIDALTGDKLTKTVLRPFWSLTEL